MVGVAPAAALVCSLLLCACSEQTAANAAAADAPARAALAPPGVIAAAPPTGYTVRARIHAQLPEMAFTLVAEPPAAAGAALNVRAIEIRRTGTPEVLQRIEGLSTATPASAQAPGLEVLDLDFDGYADIRLTLAQPAGPDLPSLHWLYQPGSGQFVAAPSLDALGSPEPDAAHRELRVQWRDGPTRNGSDFYTWQAGRPLLVRKEARQYTAPGAYTLTVSVLERGQWRVTLSQKLREP